jgi:hypothetical protein
VGGRNRPIAIERTLANVSITPVSAKGDAVQHFADPVYRRLDDLLVALVEIIHGQKGVESRGGNGNPKGSRGPEPSSGEQRTTQQNAHEQAGDPVKKSRPRFRKKDGDRADTEGHDSRIGQHRTQMKRTEGAHQRQSGGRENHGRDGAKDLTDRH